MFKVSVIVAALAAVPPPATMQQDAVSSARTFMAAFTTNPQLTRHLVTEDALFVFIDMGGRYADLLKATGTKNRMFSTCTLTSLEVGRTPSLADLKSVPAKSLHSPGQFASVQGVYSCKAPDGTVGLIDVGLLMKDGLVAELGIVPRRT